MGCGVCPLSSPLAPEGTGQGWRQQPEVLSEDPQWWCVGVSPAAGSGASARALTARRCEDHAVRRVHTASGAPEHE